MRLFGSCFMEQNKLSVAERLLRDSADTKNPALPEGHPDLAHGMCSLSDTIVRYFTLHTKTTLLSSRGVSVLSIY